MRVELEDTRLYTLDEKRTKYHSVFYLYKRTKRLNIGKYFSIALQLS